MSRFLEDPASNILSFDPSQNYTGWVLHKPESNRIINYGCIRKNVLLKGQEFSGVMEEREAFQKAFSKKLHTIMKILDPETTQVVMEKPIGSQSSRAAWALAMASQGVTTATVCTLRQEPITYRQRDAKMHMFGTDVVPKGKTLKYMWAHWLSNNIEKPENKWSHENRNAELRKMKEAVADAMLILNIHLHKLVN